MAKAECQIIAFPRRSLLAGGVAFLSQVAVPAQSASPPPTTVDPIFKAIAKHKLAEQRIEGLLDEINFDIDRPTWRKLRKAVDLASADLVATVPATPGGVAALIWYVAQNQRIGLSLGTDPVLRLIRRRANAAFRKVGAA